MFCGHFVSVYSCCIFHFLKWCMCYISCTFKQRDCAFAFTIYCFLCAPVVPCILYVISCGKIRTLSFRTKSLEHKCEIFSNDGSVLLVNQNGTGVYLVGPVANYMLYNKAGLNFSVDGCLQWTLLGENLAFTRANTSLYRCDFIDDRDLVLTNIYYMYSLAHINFILILVLPACCCLARQVVIYPFWFTWCRAWRLVRTSITRLDRNCTLFFSLNLDIVRVSVLGVMKTFPL